MERQAFEGLVRRVVNGLPDEFRDKLQNVELIVEDRPSADLLQRMEVEDGDTLFGLYEGVPLTERGFEAPLHPDRIWVFQQPIEDVCETAAEIEDEVRVTLLHEIAHFFGMDDDYLDEIGYS